MPTKKNLFDLLDPLSKPANEQPRQLQDATSYRNSLEILTPGSPHSSSAHASPRTPVETTSTGRQPSMNLAASLEPNLRSLFDIILASDFYLENRLEPLIGSAEGDAFLFQDEDLKFYVQPRFAGKSVYCPFIEEQFNKCRICNSTKTSPIRVLSCVRSHLDHRPFRCPGIAEDCRRCDPVYGYARFFSRALLRDHITSQTQKYKCSYEGCPSILRRGGMRRHWNTAHKGVPFPQDVYPGYQLPETTHVLAGSPRFRDQ